MIAIRNTQYAIRDTQYVIRRGVLLLLLFLGYVIPVFANNVRVSDPTINNPLYDEVEIGIRVTWQNSWKSAPGQAPHNWDAVWLFVKYKRSDKDNWEHATIGDVVNGSLSLSTLPSTTAEKKGVMMYRKDAGFGAFSDTITLVWDRVVDIDMASRPHVTSQVCVYAVEMVYVPQGAFYMGDGSDGTSYGVWTQSTSVPVQPYKVQNEAAISASANSGHNTASYPLYHRGPAADGYATAIGTVGLSAVYPKGYNAFYCMKTEISQGQYCAFLNKLNPMQIRSDNVEKLYSPVSLEFGDEETVAKYGNTIRKNDQGIYEVADPYRACNFLNSQKVLAYLSWAALRPMSEMEYEKACRGTLTPRPGEYAWGRPAPTQKVATAFKGSGANETYTRNSTIDSANYHFTIIARPTEGALASPGRVGAFAQAGANRIRSGASYYGILDLSGGLAELVVPITVNGSAQAFNRNAHGNGMPLVDFNGNVNNVSTWPIIPPAGGYLTGYGYRGGNFMCKPVHGTTNVNHYDPSTGMVSALDVLGGDGIGILNTIYYGSVYDYSYGHYPSKAIGQTGFYIHGYGGRGVRSF